MILLISASQVARIIEISHQCLMSNKTFKQKAYLYIACLYFLPLLDVCYREGNPMENKKLMELISLTGLWQRCTKI
jgi:hypothetical protein